MKSRRLVFRGLVHYRRTHLGALGTAALTAAVIVAALSVGDSVRSGMKRVDEARIGRVGFAAHARDRTWRQELAGELARALSGQVSGSLQLDASVALPDGSARIARARVLGVDDVFWALSPGGEPPLAPWPEDGVALSERVAKGLGVKVGDPLVVRASKPSALPREALLSSDSDAVAVFSATVAAVVDARAFGRFSLEIGPLAPANLFLPVDRLQALVDQPGRINALLLEASGEEIAGAVRGSFQPGDAGLSLRLLGEGRGWELTSRRVIIDPPAAGAALAQAGASGVLTWLVNEIRLGERSTPYSMVAALPAEHPLIPADLAEDEAVVNAWLADDLGAREGDTLTVTYFVLGEDRRLEERSTRLRVRQVVLIEGAAADPDLMPDYPGLTASEDCRDWDPGFALDLDRIRDKDETYWDEHRGTPKAFIKLSAGQRLWGSRFGNLTAVRFPQAAERGVIETGIQSRLDPASFGITFADLAGAGSAARGQGMDFGKLFLGFSAFLVAASLLLMGLVVALNVSMRRQEIATLLALGYTPRRVRRLFAVEHAIVSLAGGIAGVALGAGLGVAALAALSTVWGDVAGSLHLTLSLRPATLLSGALAGSAVSVAVAMLVLWRAIRQPVAEVFRRGEELASIHARTRGRRCYAAWIGLAFALGAVALALAAGTGRDPATAGAFFGAGALLLSAALSIIWYSLAHVGVAREGRRLSGRGLAWRNLGRRRGRSLATIGVLAFGVFLFFGVSVFRRDRLDGPGDRSAGTGGFALVGESSVPIVHDLGTPEGRKAHALADGDLEGVTVVGLRAHEGDDASCRSLTRAQAPPILGVDPDALSGRFTFVRKAGGQGDPWRALDRSDPIPAVIDQATFWTLGRGFGDEIEIEDEAGRPVPVRIAGVIDNSVLHGHLVVSESAFQKLFPSEGGYRRFLIDAPAARTDEVARVLTRQLEDRGMTLERSEERLNSYNAVENTYLGIFQALGGIGLLLGSVGLALVVGRNTIERRREFALLGAVGFTRGRIVRLVTAEHSVLLGLGLLSGLLASLLSVFPALLTPGARVATPAMGLALLALAVGGYLWTRLAARLALRGPMLENLQEE